MATSSPRSGASSALQLISFPICPYVHRATAMLREKRVDHEITYIDLDNKPDWFLAISPRGLVPVLVTEGTPLFESAAILEYLDETREPRFLPEDPIERARQRAWIAVADELMVGQYRVAIAPDRAELDKMVEAARRSLARFDAAVALPFFASDRFGMVDAAAAPALYRLLLIEERSPLRFFGEAPKAKQWADNVASRPSVREGVRPSFAEEFFAYSSRKGGHLAELAR
jgi:glutathione S-transferase